MNRTTATILIILAFAGAVGFLLYSRNMVNAPSGFPPARITNSSNVTSTYGGYGAADSGKISFSDTAESNSDQQIPLSELKLLNTDLEDVTLSDLQGDQNLLLVVIRGVPLCPFCTAQTSRLVNNYKKKNSEVGQRSCCRISWYERRTQTTVGHSGTGRSTAALPDSC